MVGLLLAIASFVMYMWKRGGSSHFASWITSEVDHADMKMEQVVAALKSKNAFLSHPELSVKVVNGDEGHQGYELPDYVLKLEVVHVFPHDPTSFTQGLFVDHEDDDRNHPRKESTDNGDLVLVESLGQYGKSALQKRSLSTGELLSGERFSPFVNPPSEFGEGATWFKGYYWQLVWQKAVIHQYEEAREYQEDHAGKSGKMTNSTTFNRVNTFDLSGIFDFDDGWGLTSDGEDFLYATDSGNKLFKLELVTEEIGGEGNGANAELLESGSGEMRSSGGDEKIRSNTSRGKKIIVNSVRLAENSPPQEDHLGKLNSKAPTPPAGVKVKAKYNKLIEMPNELQWIPGITSSGTSSSTFGATSSSAAPIFGEVWANIFGKDCIARIRPEDGKVSGFVIAPLLRREFDLGKTQDVMNGIAFDAKSGRLFVTGKYWSKLFEVRLAPIGFKLEWDVVKQLCVPEKNIFHSGRTGGAGKKKKT